MTYMGEGLPLGFPHIFPHCTSALSSHKGSSYDGSHASSPCAAGCTLIISFFSLFVLVFLGLLGYELRQVATSNKVFDVILQVHTFSSVMAVYVMEGIILALILSPRWSISIGLPEQPSFISILNYVLKGGRERCILTI